MKWIGQNIYDQVSKFRNTVDFSEDVTFYQPVNNADPQISIGSSDDERLRILINYQGTTTQAAQIISFKTFTEGDAANDGKMQFVPDEVHVLDIDDGGIDFKTGFGISINGTDILTDSSGTATLSNIDALDATTISTLNAALTAGDITGVTAGTGLSGGGTSGAVTLNVEASQALTSVVFDGNRSVTPRDGTKIHVDAATITDSSTSASGTATNNNTVAIEPQTLAATNASVTNTHAASLYIGGPPSAGTNMTLTNAYAIYAPAGNVKLGGALAVGGTITGDVTGDLTGNADTATTAGTVTTAAQPAIESIGTDGDTLAILADQLVMSNATADMPTIKLTNITDDDAGPSLVLEKLRDDNAVAQGQNLGEIWFRGQDGSQNTEDYAYIIGEIDVSAHGQESGSLSLGVANHDGGNGAGLILTGGSEDNEIDVTVGLGANSVVTIPGDIDLAGDIDVDGTLETDALTIGGVTVAAAGTASITTLGTIGTGVWEGTAIASDQQKHLMHYSIAGYGIGDGTNYEMVNQLSGNTAPFEHDISIGADGVTATATNNMVRSAGIVMPRACTLKRWTGWATSNGSGDSFVGLFKVTPTRNDNTALSAVELEEFQFTALGHSKMEDFDIVEGDMTATAIAAGDIIISAVKGVSGKTVYFTSTFEVEF